MKKAFRVKNDMAKMTEQNRTKRRFVVLRRFMGICPVHKRPDDEMGLTLIELVIVLAVIGILSAIAVPTFLSYRNKAKVALAVSEIKMLEKKI
ncbi:MAG: prepilin-type N-terminal cleavage/methylation domain-containing protein, partial [Desulfobacterales bacterium]